MEKSENSERRKNTRVDFSTVIVLKTVEGEITASGRSKDLSLKGLFVSTEEEIALDTKCSVRVSLLGSSEPIDLAMEGRVVRIEDKGLGVIFDTMDLDSYTHLKNIVMYNKDDSDDL